MMPGQPVAELHISSFKRYFPIFLGELDAAVMMSVHGLD
jgi:hypothetical protein